ncbi:ATP-binding protein [Vulgatibacter sp.]|uniref:ATP-binding protein n=1 Tax=Vulgatibacter sp. TaxID=1971226 RepID=UPI0035693324
MHRAPKVRPDRTSFVGRERELSALRTMIADGIPFITLTGPSGMGKTRIARRLASELDGEFLGVEACATQADLRAAVAERLRLAGERVGDALAARGPLLLVLDNVDPHARPLAGVLEEWLERCPELTLLVTSLVPLGIRGEVRFELGPLGEKDAVVLYLDRARDAAADRPLAPAEREALDELVLRLDRLPLAIELAAARVRVLPPRQLLERISQRLALLRSAEGSLTHALSLSWNLLTADEQRVLARASVFAGGFTLAAAEAILRSDFLVDHLDGLRAKALLQLDVDRFSLYESVREFAALRLRELGGATELERQHAAYFASEGTARAGRAEGPEALAALRWLATDRENLLAAHRRSFGAAPELAARTGLALAALFSRGGPVAFQRELLDACVQAARRTGDPQLLVQALHERGRVRKREGGSAAARADVDEGLCVARAHGDRASEGHLLIASASLRVPASDPEARTELERALAIGADEGEPFIEGQALLVLGALEESRGAIDSAATRTEEALVLFRRGGHLRFCGIALLNLGAIHSHRGRFSAARNALEQACAIFASLENLTSLSYATTNLGSLALAMGDLDEAEKHLLEVLALDRRSSNRQLHGIATGQLAIVALERGELREAERRLADGIAALRELGVKRERAMLLPFHAAALALLGGTAEARAELSEARAAFDELGDPAGMQMLALLEGIVALSEARRVTCSGSDASSLEARARELLAAPICTGVTVEGLFVARRLLGQALARRAAAEAAPPGLHPGALVVARDATYFSFAGGERVDLRRRGAVRHLLRGLVENRLIAPGVGASADELAAIGWPGEKILPTAAATRVWNAIRILRGLGLAPVLLRHADGYLLDPALAVVRE